MWQTRISNKSHNPQSNASPTTTGKIQNKGDFIGNYETESNQKSTFYIG